jgi:hypothetical protein
MGKSGRTERTVMISVEEPRPLLNEGKYRARCTAATIAWSRRWKKWIVKLHMEPLDYAGRPYSGQLCRFLSLGTDPKRPRAGQGSRFRTLWVEVNGGQPTQGEVDLGIFEGAIFEIVVRTVKTRADKDRTPIPPEHWYSVCDEVIFCKGAQRTLEHSNTRTPQHSNTAPSNLLTLNQTQQHHNTPTPRVPAPRSAAREDVLEDLEIRKAAEKQAGVEDPDSWGGTYSRHTPRGGDAKKNVSPRSQARCYIHGNHAPFWARPDGSPCCELCHPTPGFDRKELLQ